MTLKIPNAKNLSEEGEIIYESKTTCKLLRHTLNGVIYILKTGAHCRVLHMFSHENEDVGWEYSSMMAENQLSRFLKGKE